MRFLWWLKWAQATRKICLSEEINLLELFRTRALEMQMSATNTLDMQIASQTTRDLPMTINNR